MTDSITGNGHEDLNQAILRVEAYLERLEQVTQRLEKIAGSEENVGHDGSKRD